MTVRMPRPVSGEMHGLNRELVHAHRRIVDTARLRMAVQLGALALVACLPLALFLYVSAPARHAVLGQRDAAVAACGSVYDPVACRCAVNAMAVAEPRALGLPDDGLMVAAALPTGRVEASRVPVALTPGLVQQVQSCTAGSGARAD